MTATTRPHLFESLFDLAVALGAKSIKDLPACWEHAWQHAGNVWHVAIHAGPGPRRTSTGVEIPPFEFWIECNGWPAGMVGMTGYSVAAGSVVNEETLRTAIAAVQSGGAT